MRNHPCHEKRLQHQREEDDDDDGKKPPAMILPPSQFGFPPFLPSLHQDQPVVVSTRPIGTTTLIEGGLPFLAIPFLAAGDLPTLAAVSKSAKRLASSSWKERLNSNKIDIKKFDLGTIAVQKQEMVFLKQDNPPTQASYHKNNKALHLYRYRSSGLSGCAVVFGNNNDDVCDPLFFNIQGQLYNIPQQLLHNLAYDFLQHCSVVNETIVVTVVTVADDDWSTRNLWAILYYTAQGGSVGNSAATEATHVQKLVTKHRDYADTYYIKGHFGGGYRSGNGNVFVVVTELDPYLRQHQQEEGGNTMGACTLTAYNLVVVPPEARGGNNETKWLEKIRDVNMPWYWGEKHVSLDASLSTCGQLLSVCTRGPTTVAAAYGGDQDMGMFWRIFDLRTNNTDKNKDNDEVVISGSSSVLELYNGDVTSASAYLDFAPHFTADNEIVMYEDSTVYQRLLDKYDEEEAGCSEFSTAAAAEYAQKDIEDKYKFAHVRDYPSFCKRVIVSVGPKKRKDRSGIP